MTYEEILKNAGKVMDLKCRACAECNGRACGSKIPGPGAKGCGDTAMRNYDMWKKIRINLDTIAENKEIDTTFSLFGKTFSCPIFAGPVGAVSLHYGEKYDDFTYNEVMIEACAKAGIAAFTGDGAHADVVRIASKIIKKNKGIGVPTIKPWDIETVKKKIDLVHESGAFAMAMDIDAAGLDILKGMQPKSGRKTVQELYEIIHYANIPFIIKGIMTAKGALKAKEAGASAIVVSNHGGRVQDGCPSTAEVLPEIADAAGNDMAVLVDGGIRSGTDVFRALSLGADGVLICRPFVPMVYGGGEEGVLTYIKKLKEELSDTMMMCGASNLKEINRNMVYKNHGGVFDKTYKMWFN